MDIVPGKRTIAEIAQLVEHDLAKVGVAGSSPVFRSLRGVIIPFFVLGIVIHDIPFFESARMVEQVDTQDLKSCGQ